MSEEDSPVAPNQLSGGEEAPPLNEETEEDAAAGIHDAAEPVANETVNRFANMNMEDSGNDDSDTDSDDEEHPMSTLPPYVLQRVEKLKDLDTKRDEIMEEYLKDRAALEAKYQGLCKPLFDERLDIIKGDKDDEISKKATAEGESKNGKETEEESNKVETVEDGDKEAHGNEDKVVGIPQFWVCAMSHMEPLAELLTDEDVDCLEHLQNIVCVDDPDGTGFTLEFHFTPNDYFDNTVLTKRYEVPNLLLEDEPILKNVEGCKIEWKAGRSLTFRETTKKQRGTGKKAGMVRTVKKKERRESFFHFFEPPKMPSMDNMDEDEADRLEEAFESDYDVAQAFRSHIIPKAVMWYTGQVSLVCVK